MLLSTLLCTIALISGAQGSISCKKPAEEVILRINLALFIDKSLDSQLENSLKLNSSKKSLLLHSYIQQVNINFSGLKSPKISKIHYELVRIFYEQGDEFDLNQNSGGNIDELLDNFCQYQASLKRESEWDASLLLTAEDLYSEEEARESSMEVSRSTMGISVLGGIQWDDLSCSVVEFGPQISDALAQIRMTSSMSISAWVSTHELAHGLGIHHDGPPFNADCPSSCRVMSPESSMYTGTTGENCHTWSKCSSETLHLLDLRKFYETQWETVDYALSLPGQLFEAHMQCRMHSGKGFSAQISPMICNETLQCINSEYLGTVSIGLALEGTICDEQAHLTCMNMVCQ